MIKVRVVGISLPSKKSDLGIPHGGVLNMALFLVTINNILGEMGNEVEGLLFADDLAMGIEDMTNLLPQYNSSHGLQEMKKEKQEISWDYIKRLSLQRKYLVFEDHTEQSNALGKAYIQNRAKAKRAISGEETKKTLKNCRLKFADQTYTMATQK